MHPQALWHFFPKTTTKSHFTTQASLQKHQDFLVFFVKLSIDFVNLSNYNRIFSVRFYCTFKFPDFLPVPAWLSRSWPVHSCSNVAILLQHLYQWPYAIGVVRNHLGVHQGLIQLVKRCKVLVNTPGVFWTYLVVNIAIAKESPLTAMKRMNVRYTQLFQFIKRYSICLHSYIKIHSRFNEKLQVNHRIHGMIAVSLHEAGFRSDNSR